jgi:hypothetical protein
MRPLLAIVIALTLVAVAAAVGLFAGEHRPPAMRLVPRPLRPFPRRPLRGHRGTGRQGPRRAGAAAARRHPRARAHQARASKRAEDFSLNTPGSGKVRLLDYRGKSC